VPDLGRLPRQVVPLTACHRRHIDILRQTSLPHNGNSSAVKAYCPVNRDAGIVPVAQRYRRPAEGDARGGPDAAAKTSFRSFVRVWQDLAL
jgi:hypothetical protein